jgi:hypothetical protein
VKVTPSNQASPETVAFANEASLVKVARRTRPHRKFAFLKEALPVKVALRKVAVSTRQSSRAKSMRVASVRSRLMSDQKM